MAIDTKTNTTATTTEDLHSEQGLNLAITASADRIRTLQSLKEVDRVTMGEELKRLVTLRKLLKDLKEGNVQGNQESHESNESNSASPTTHSDLEGDDSVKAVVSVVSIPVKESAVETAMLTVDNNNEDELEQKVAKLEAWADDADARLDRVMHALAKAKADAPVLTLTPAPAETKVAETKGPKAASTSTVAVKKTKAAPAPASVATPSVVPAVVVEATPVVVETTEPLKATELDCAVSYYSFTQGSKFQGEVPVSAPALAPTVAAPISAPTKAKPTPTAKPTATKVTKATAKQTKTTEVQTSQAVQESKGVQTAAVPAPVAVGPQAPTASLAELEAEQARRTQLEQQLQVLETQLEDERKQLQAATQAATELAAAREAELKAAQVQLKCAQDELARETQRSTFELDSASGMTKRLQNDLKKMTSERQEADRITKALQADLVARTERVDVLTQEISQLMKRLAATETELETAREGPSVADVQALESRVAVLQAQVQEAASKQQEVAQELELQTICVHSLEDQLETKAQALAALEAHAAVLAANPTKEDLESLEDLVVQLKQTVVSRTMERDAQVTAVAAVTLKLQAVEAQLVSMTEAHQTTQAMLESKDAEKETVVEQLLAAQEKQAETARELKAMEALLATKTAAHAAEVAKHQKTSGALSREHAEAKKMWSETTDKQALLLKEKLQEVATLNARLRTREAESESEAKRLKAEALALKESLAVAVQKSERLQKALSTQETAVQKKEAEVKQGKQAFQALRVEMAALQTTLKLATDAEKAKSESLDALMESEAHARNEMVTFRRENGKLADIIASLKKEKAAAESEAQQAVSQYTQQQQQYRLIVVALLMVLVAVVLSRFLV